MLKTLSVKDFAIIEDIHIDFSAGMTVLTGETGAGKSLIIDTISLLLGARADSDMIRFGKKKAVIQGVFDYESTKIDDLLERFSIPKTSQLAIERQIYDTSKNTIKVNNVTITLAMLRQLSTFLADIHSQADTYQLFHPERYLDILKPVGDTTYDNLLAKYLRQYSHYMEAYHKYQHVSKGQKETLKHLDYLTFEKKEIENLQLSEHVDEELALEVSKLENYDKLFSSLTDTYECLQNEYFSIDMIYQAKECLKKIDDLDPIYKEYVSKLTDCYYNLDEIRSEVARQIDGLDFDQEELNSKIERLNEIEKVKKKYHKSVPELMSYLKEITLEIDMVINYDDVLKECLEALKTSFNDTLQAAQKLSQYRRKLAIQIENAVIKECKDLDLDQTHFKITFENVNTIDPLDPSIFDEFGLDHVDFHVSFNEGEPLRSLHKVASGGELSRMMLAFKGYLNKQSNFSLMVFDEIDTGVSGATAKKIAIKLASIAKDTQILCITHLPQVASIGNAHIHIYKETLDHRTTTHFKYLTFDERVEEVAMMLSGDKLSLYALEHAKALLSENR